MCIICVKKAGAERPNDDTIETMWLNNPDGAGFMYAYKGKVYIEKGFMKLEELLKAIHALESEIDLKSIPFVLHCRITTHGGTKPANCHPFPITENVGIMQKLSTRCEIGMAHNGILDITPRSKDISDTMEYIARDLAIMKKINRKFLQNKYFLQLIDNNISGSRLAFLTGDGDIVTLGQWVEDGDLKYSNSNYKYSYSYGYKKSYYYDNCWGYSPWDEPFDTKPVCDAWSSGYEVWKNGKKEDLLSVATPDYYIDRSGVCYEYDPIMDGLYESDAKAIIQYDKKGWSKDQSIMMDIFKGGAVRRCYICGHEMADDEGTSYEGGIICDDCYEYFKK